MEKENRPFAFNDIHERIGKQVAKQLLEKTIEQQVAGNRLNERTNGKLKVYCYNNSRNKINIDAVKDCTKFN